jgi:hypothetical protein
MRKNWRGSGKSWKLLPGFGALEKVSPDFGSHLGKESRIETLGKAASDHGNWIPLALLGRPSDPWDDHCGKLSVPFSLTLVAGCTSRFHYDAV